MTGVRFIPKQLKPIEFKEEDIALPAGAGNERDHVKSSLQFLNAQIDFINTLPEVALAVRLRHPEVTFGDLHAVVRGIGFLQSYHRDATALACEHPEEAKRLDDALYDEARSDDERHYIAALIIAKHRLSMALWLQKAAEVDTVDVWFLEIDDFRCEWAVIEEKPWPYRLARA